MNWRHRYLFIIISISGHLSASAQTSMEMQWRNLGLADGLPDHTIHASILQDSYGRIWLGSDDGLFVYDGYGIARFRSTPPEQFNKQEQHVQSLYLADDGTIWVSLRSNGIIVIDPNTNHVRPLQPERDGGPLPAERIWHITRAQDNSLWIGSDAGLLHTVDNGGSFEFFTSRLEDYGQNRIAYFNAVRRVLEDPRQPNRFLLATRGGLVQFDYTSRQFQLLKMPYSSITELGMDAPNYLIMDFALQQDTLLWCGTWSGGLIGYNLVTGNWRRYHDPGTFPQHEIINSIGLRDAGSLWIATQRGFGIFYSDPGTYEYFHERPVDYPILADAALDFAFLSDGTLVVARSGGLSICSSAPWYDAGQTGYTPFLSAIYVDGKDMSGDTDAVHIHQLAIGHSQKSITLQTVLPVFRDTTYVQYRYLLEPHDANWIETGTRSVVYRNLPKGTYFFKYQARFGDEAWSPGATIPVLFVEVAIWKNPWAILIVMFLITGVAYLMHRMRIRQIRSEQKKTSEVNKKIAALEMSVLRAQMNPHFMFNSLNSIKNYILKEKTDEASGYLTKFSQLMRAVLSNSKHTVVPLKEELRALALYIELEALRFEGEFQWSIFVDPTISPDALGVPPLLIQPYVENAIRHGLLEKDDGVRNLEVEIRPCDDTHIAISVRDNGIGRDQSRSRQSTITRNRSYGMQITKDRIDLIAETLGIQAAVSVTDLADSAGDAAGTLVEIRIPRLSLEKSTVS